MEEKFRKIKNRLEIIVENKDRTVQIEIDGLKIVSQNEELRNNIIIHHRNFMAGVNLVYQTFCIEFNVPYEPIKSKFTTY